MVAPATCLTKYGRVCTAPVRTNNAVLMVRENPHASLRAGSPRTLRILRWEIYLNTEWRPSSNLYPLPLYRFLSLVVGLAQHLAVLNARRAALAPCRDVVGVHFIQPPDLTPVGFMSGAHRGQFDTPFALALAVCPS